MKNVEKIEEFKAMLRTKEGLWECMEGLDNEDPSSIECFDIYIKNNPEDIDAHIGKALAIYNTGRWEDAIQQLTDGLKLDPVYESGLLLRAEILRENGKLQFALKFYEKLLVISPNDENYLKQKAELLEEISQPEDEEEPQPEDADDSERVMMFRGMRVTKAAGPEFIPKEEEESLEVQEVLEEIEEFAEIPEEPEEEALEEPVPEGEILKEPVEEEVPQGDMECPTCGSMNSDDSAMCFSCSANLKDPAGPVDVPDDKEPTETTVDLGGLENGDGLPELGFVRELTPEIDGIVDDVTGSMEEEDDDILLKDLENVESLLEFGDEEEEIDGLDEMVCNACGEILDPDDDICKNCGDEPDKVMVMRGITVSRADETHTPTLNNYEEDRWSSFVDKVRTDRNRTVSIMGVFCIISIAVYLIYISLQAIYDSFFIEFDTIVLIPNLIIFIMGFGALYGGVSIAKNSIVFDHFLDSIFETEIYPRLEPALEEVAQVQARLDNIEEKMERMNMNISRNGKYPSAAEFPAVAISNRITSFLKIVVVINITLGILLYTISNPGRYAPYLFTIMFMLWWGVITDDYDLWKNAISWAWAILPIFAVPFMSIFLYVVMPIGTLIGLIGGFLIIYAYSYYAWVRYYVEGKLPFNVHEAQLEEEKEEE